MPLGPVHTHGSQNIGLFTFQPPDTPTTQESLTANMFGRNQKQIQNFVCKTLMKEKSLKVSDGGVLLS
jgi:hypothetical protein